MPLFRRKKHHNMGLMALAKETANMAKNMMVLDKTEAALEREVEKEEKRPLPKTTIGKIRRKGEHVIHGKYVLLIVILLNVIDCLLVLAELILDIEYITDLLKIEENRSTQFIGAMKCRYPASLGELGSEATHIDELIEEILNAKLTWDHRDTGSDVVPAYNSTRRRRSLDGLVNTSAGNSMDCGDGTFLHGFSDSDHLEEKIAHSIHKASITILGILFLENMFKIFCVGKAMVEHKLECFDSFIVTASFILDIVFVKGSQQFSLHELVLFMAFIVPWRIIRVVNSLVVAIMYHEHLRLVLVYKHKKKISQELKEAKKDINGLKECIDALRKLCTDAGISDTSIDFKLNVYWKVKAQTNVTGALSSFALGGGAMKKPFIIIANGDIPNSSSVVTADTNVQAKKIETAKDNNGNLSQELTAIKQGSFSSHPAIETYSTEHENTESLQTHTEDITSIHNVRERNEGLSKSNETEKEYQSNILHISDGSRSDTYEAKDKFVNDDNDDGADDGEGSYNNSSTHL